MVVLFFPFRSRIGLCAAMLLSLTATPLEAATDLTNNLLSTRSSMVLHVKDFKKLHGQIPLPLRSIEKLMPSLSLISDIVSSATFRMGLPRNFGKLENAEKQKDPIVIAQIPLTVDFDISAALELAEDPLTPFELEIPKGVSLRPLGQRNNMFLAKTDLDGQTYLLLASSPELLLSMASNDNRKEEPRRLDDGMIWGKMIIDPSDLSEDQAGTLSAPLRIEYDAITSEKELTFKFHVNTREIVSHFFEASPKLTEEARHLPMVAGNGPLHLLISWNNSFIKPDLTLKDLLKQYSPLLSPETMNNLESYSFVAQESIGVQWSDLFEVLRGTITLGVIGSVDSPWGAIPGFYLHLGGAGEKLKAGLMEMMKLASEVEPQMKGIRFIEGPTWKGYSTPEGTPVMASLLSVPEGLVITSLPPEQLFSGTPELSMAMAAMTTIPAISSIGIDIASLLPFVQKLWKDNGASAFQSMTNQKKPLSVDEAQKIFNNLFQWSDLTVTARDEENVELRLLANAEPPVVKLETPLPAKEPLCTCDGPVKKTSDQTKKTPQK